MITIIPVGDFALTVITMTKIPIGTRMKMMVEDEEDEGSLLQHLHLRVSFPQLTTMANTKEEEVEAM